jgi:predicted nucleotidyltransferase
MSKKEIIAVLRQLKSSFTEKYGVLAIGIFGSVARDEAREDSDVDVVVKMTQPDLFFMVHIKEQVEAACHRKADIVHYREHMNPFLKRRIDREVIYV